MSSRRRLHRVLLAVLPLFGLIAAPWLQAAQANAVPHWRPAHVVVVIEENKSFSTIVGNPDAPYINQLAGQGLVFTDAHAIVHPSQPNYVALFAGSTYGLTDDSCPHDLNSPNLASELLAKKLSFAIYSESMPEAGFTGCSASNGLYRRKHNPVADFQGHLPATVNLPFSDFPRDYAKLPTVAFVVPNMMNDMHDGTIAEGDTWLKAHLSRYAAWANTHDSLLIVTWDESDARSLSNQILLIVVGAHVKRGSNDAYVNHYSLLAMLERFYVLDRLGDSAETSALNLF
ncbi:MAG: acid phosphatase [Gammaproteobacteria bacterium]|nr:alkaline phosphatase family protein [Gammaproteobacteria bacterium]MDE2138986.1 acid phosphatase [Gammaproteobacteria bacterium]